MLFIVQVLSVGCCVTMGDSNQNEEALADLRHYLAFHHDLSVSNSLDDETHGVGTAPAQKALMYGEGKPKVESITAHFPDSTKA